MKLKELQKIFPSATAETWHQHPNGGGWVENTARVEETAYVGERAQVFGYAQMSGYAWLSGNAQMSGNAWEFSPLQIQGSRHFLCVSRYGYIRVGCEEHTPAWWRKHHKALGVANGYTKQQLREYVNLLVIAERWMRIMGVDKPSGRKAA